MRATGTVPWPESAPSHGGKPFESRALPCPGETLDGKYRIDGVLGYGGMGVVFAATHLGLGQRVAIKMLLPEWVSEPSVVKRFAREGRASAAIRSEHIVRVFDVDECEGRPYLVLEYLEGEDFDGLLARRGPLPVVEAVDLLLQACEAIAEVHVAGTIHRDLKPANLFLTHRADGSPCVKVLDFGISKIASDANRTSVALTGGGTSQTVMGSPKYMSPEQMQSATDADERSDIWAMGTILHELLTGAPPFTGETVTEVCAHVMSEPTPSLAAVRADVASGLDDVVHTCLEKDRERRYPTVAELARALAPFGSDASRESAERISRIVDGGIARGDAGIERTSHARPISAKSRVDSNIGLPRGVLKRPIAGYVLAIGALFTLAGAVGWAVVHQELAVRGARAALSGAELWAPARPSAMAQPTHPPVTLPATSLPSTTSALVAVPAVGPAQSAPPNPPSAPTAAAAPMRRATPTPHVHAAPRRSGHGLRAPSLPSWAAPTDAAPEPSAERAPSLVQMTPALAPLVSAAAPTSEIPSAAPSASATSPPSGDELFEGRK